MSSIISVPGSVDPTRQAADCDLVLRHGTIVDGSGAPARVGDVALKGDMIVAVGYVRPSADVPEIDVGGLIVAPGFIDVHTHDDRMILRAPQALPKVTQGVTTVVTGNCGISLAPYCAPGAVQAPLDLLSDDPAEFFESFESFLSAVEVASPAVNVVPLVGHMALRASVGVTKGEPATDDDVARMRDMLAGALAQGAFGFSTGLAYPLSRHASTSEVIALAAEAGRAGGIYTTHMRDEGVGVSQSLEESFLTAREAGVRLVISHHKCLGAKVWGRSVRTLAAIDEARQTIDLAIDAYPYTASSTVLLPGKLKWSKETFVTWSTPFPEVAGRRVEEIAAEWGCTQEEAAERLMPAGAIYVTMDEADVRRILQHPLCMIGSDGLPHDRHPHPRLWGTFPRVLGHYSRDVGLFTIEQAVHRMTGLPARHFGIPDRGLIQAGFKADLCVFDPIHVADRATFRDPTQAAVGILHVFVNGVPVLRNGVPTGAGPGHAILNPNLRDPSGGPP